MQPEVKRLRSSWMTWKKDMIFTRPVKRAFEKRLTKLKSVIIIKKM